MVDYKDDARRGIEASNILDYSLADVVAEGSFGEILLSRDKTGIEVAIKRIKLTKPKDVFKFRTEVEVLKLCVGQKNIVQLIEFIEFKEEAFIVLEKAEGDLLHRLMTSTSVFSEDSVSKAMRCIASALAFLHDLDISHRDLKPDNVLCFSRDDIFPLKLCDFDLCSYKETDSLQTKEFKSQVGSFEYMAPEIASLWLGEESCYRKECDLWSLGAIMYAIFFKVTLFAFPLFDDCPLKCGGDCRDCVDVQLKIVKTGDYVVNENFKKLSRSAIHLLMSLLRVEPHLRLNAKEVLGHEWIVNYGYI